MIEIRPRGVQLAPHAEGGSCMTSGDGSSGASGGAPGGASGGGSDSRCITALSCDLVFLDCEATSLKGLITEVGLARLSRDLTVTSWSALVALPEVVADPLLFDPEAQAVTGISHAMVCEHGISAKQAVSGLEAFVAQSSFVLSDAVSYECNWIDQLYRAADRRVRARPSFDIRDVGYAFSLLDDRSAETSLRRKTRLDLAGVVHRAGPDARRWAECIRYGLQHPSRPPST